MCGPAIVANALRSVGETAFRYRYDTQAWAERPIVVVLDAGDCGVADRLNMETGSRVTKTAGFRPPFAFLDGLPGQARQ
jgi:hypothetical protein